MGILATELIQRGRGKRIPVVTQKAMLTQFQKEWWSRFSAPLFPNGTFANQWVTHGTPPGDPRTVERRYVGPFARANCKEDYRIAWSHFQSTDP